jgi:hypothetical protein
MPKTLKVETMQKRTAEHKELIIDELGYCKRLIDNIINDTKKIEYQHQYGLDTEPSDARYAVEEAYRYMATIRAILSRYWKNKHDEFVSYEGYEDLRAIRLSKQKMFKDKMDEVLQCVDNMDII